MADRRGGKDGLGPLAGVGAVVALVICCAAPLLIAAGVFAGAGALLRSGWPFLLAGAAVTAAVAVTLWRRRDRRRADETGADGDVDSGVWQRHRGHTDGSSRLGE